MNDLRVVANLEPEVVEDGSSPPIVVNAETAVYLKRVSHLAERASLYYLIFFPVLSIPIYLLWRLLEPEIGIESYDFLAVVGLFVSGIRWAAVLYGVLGLLTVLKIRESNPVTLKRLKIYFLSMFWVGVIVAFVIYLSLFWTDKSSYELDIRLPNIILVIGVLGIGLMTERVRPLSRHNRLPLYYVVFELPGWIGPDFCGILGIVSAFIWFYVCKQIKDESSKILPDVENRKLAEGANQNEG